ncbi:MAG: proline dehydrogenase family protein [Deltaproteobacteria bacterium]|nr:proline dehydrogenase family protein [Deltaproteobacteria bacterium]
MSFLIIFARRFVAGEELSEAIPSIKRLNDKGIMTTIDHLGENVTSEEIARAAADSYLEILDIIEREKLNSNVSLKLTQMGLDLGDDFCFSNVERIVEKAYKLNNFVRIDMEGSKYTQRTLDISYRLFEKYGNVGVVIQSMLLRSEDDIKELNKRGIRVRLCKGAYKEPEAIAFQKKEQVNENYIKLMKMLLTEGKYPAIATHDEKIINECKRFVKENKIDSSRFEFQMLYGIRRDLQVSLVKEGYRMRVYVPYGKEWFPYFYRRLRERKENVFFVLRNFFRG